MENIKYKKTGNKSAKPQTSLRSININWLGPELSILARSISKPAQ